MAIEKGLGATGDIPIPEEAIQASIDVIELPEMPGVAEMDDGSAIVGELLEQDPMAAQDVPFDANLAEFVDDSELTRISSDLVNEIEEDMSSRQDWEDTYKRGIELLGMNYEERSQPFEGASGVVHPLLAESVTQFQAQAYREMLPAGGPVRTQVMGADTPDIALQAQRVKDYMNYMITYEMEEYDPETDQMLFYLPIIGSTFKKIYFDPLLQRAVSKFVHAEDLVVPYGATDLLTSPRTTHVIRMDKNEVLKLQLSGFYRETDIGGNMESEDYSEIQESVDKAQGVQMSGSGSEEVTLYEVHTSLDLEGFEDMKADGEMSGLKLPYIVTIVESTGEILSLRRNYSQDDPMMRQNQYFVHYKFLPGFGFYGLGLIHTIGGLSRTATAALRQLIDAGTLSNLPAGFKARGLRIRDDDEPLQPGEFRDVDAPGGAIRDSLMPLPFKGPDQTLFNLLGFVVQAGQRFATITDLKVGDGNQNAAVGTTIAMLEQGSRVMSAVHKRLHYAMRIEFKMLARVMSESLPQEYPYSVEGAESAVMASDFDDKIDVVPVSDPNMFSQAQRIALAQTKLQLAGAAPELHNMYEVYKDMYEALGVKDIDRVMKSIPDEEPTPKDPAQENIDSMDMVPLQAFEGQEHEAHIMAHMVFGSTPMVAGMPAIAMALQKHIMEHVKIAARERAAVQFIQSRQAVGGEAATEEEMLQIEGLTAQFIAEGMQMVKQMSQQVSGQGPDPLVQLKEQELQIKAQAEQADAQNDAAKLNLDAQNQQMRGAQFQQRLASQEKQTSARIQSAMERELLKQRGP